MIAVLFLLAAQQSVTYAQPRASQTEAAAASRLTAPQQYGQMGQEGVLGLTRYSVEKTPLGQLAANARVREILEDEIPGLLSHASFREIADKPLARIAPPGQMAMSPQKLQTIQSRLDAMR